VFTVDRNPAVLCPAAMHSSVCIRMLNGRKHVGTIEAAFAATS